MNDNDDDGRLTYLLKRSLFDSFFLASLHLSLSLATCDDDGGEFPRSLYHFFAFNHSIDSINTYASKIHFLYEIADFVEYTADKLHVASRIARFVFPAIFRKRDERVGQIQRHGEFSQ